MPYLYTYLLMGAIFFIPWLVLFLWRKDVRKEMIVISLLGGILGPLADILYVKDWWSPVTLTHTKIGIEAVIVGFMICGIGGVIYEELFKKKVVVRKKTRGKRRLENEIILFVIITAVALFFGSFYLLKINSFYATILTATTLSVVILSWRRDLIIDAVFSGISLVVVSIAVYNVLEMLTPGWISAFWHFKNTPQIIILNLPVDDFVWYFVAGIFLGPLYEFWQEGKLVNVQQTEDLG